MSAIADEPMGLTRRQTLFWLDEELFPGAPYHHHALTIRLAGPLDRDRLEAALRSTQEDIDQFRLVIEVHEGRPMQRLRAQPVLQLESIDLASEPETFDAWLVERTIRPFDFAESLHRAALVRLGPETHVFCLFVHHIASDGTSIATIVRHLAARYAGTPVPTRPSFLDYVESERTYLATKKAEKDAAHWRAKLAGGTPPLAFYGRARTSRSVECARLWVDGGEARFRTLVERAGRDPFQLLNPSVSRLVVLATVLFAYVHRATGNRRLAIGTPVPNRSSRHVDTCGLLMEQIFLVAEIDEEETFSTLADKVRNEIFQGFRHAQHCVSDRGLSYVTLNLLTDRFGPFGELAARVRLQSATTMPALSLPDVCGDLRDTFGIQVHDFEGDERLLVGFDMHRDTFDVDRRARVPVHFLNLVDALCRDPDQRIDAVDLLDEEERHTMLELVRGDDTHGPSEDLLEAIHGQMRMRPEHLAIVSGAKSFTYAELSHRVNVLARMLQSLGVGPETCVGLLFVRGPDEVVGMLATLQAGGAYVPLDPTHPPDRIALILEDASPSVLLTHSTLASTAVVPEATRVIALDEQWPSLLEGDGRSLDLDVDPEQLAYVLFTSGSTGRPKGVEIPRRALSNFLRSMSRTPGLAPTDRLLAVTTVTFDIAGLELFLPLFVGATVQIVDRETAMDPLLLRRMLESEPITTIQATPATFRLLVEAGFRGKSGLRVFVGGEALSPELAAALLTRSDELWNLYGPTETTVWSTAKRIDDASHITIGRPIDRTQVYVLDAGRNIVPMGTVGELAIGGDGLARGYRGRPDLTSTRFVANPYGTMGERIYLTGDLARALPNGEFECLGRIDHQVKIRGFRIELGEIESTLRSIDGVREVVVLARKDDSAEPRLVAYYVADAPVARDRFVARVVEKLPRYMHPAAYVQLEAFPLNTNGKIDRATLPSPTEVRGEGPQREARRPRNDAETRMVTLFRDVLGHEDIGIDDDFFSLGGSSPLALELRHRVERTFGVELPLRALFENPTPLGLVSRLGERADASESIVVLLRKGPDDEAPLFCLLGIQLYDELARRLVQPRSVYGLHIPIRFSPAREDPPPVTEIARRYVEAIRAIRPHGPYALVGLCFGGVVAVEVASELLRAGETVELVGVVDAVLPRGIHLDRRARLLSLVERAIGERHRIPAYLRDRAERALNRLPPSAARMYLARLLTDPSSALATDAIIDLPLSGPIVEAQYLGFERTARLVDTRLLVFRATAGPTVAGVHVAKDCGFEGLSKQLSVHRIPGDHLGLLKPPHVDTVAAQLEAALAERRPPSG